MPNRSQRWFLFAIIVFVVALVPVRADYGDHWAPRHDRVAVYEGPDRGFPVVTYIGRGDRVRQESNRKIRGFLKISLPDAGGLGGYVLERQLTFVPTPVDDSVAQAISERRRLTAEIADLVRARAGGFPWAGLLLLSFLAVLAIGFVLFVRRVGAARVAVTGAAGANDGEGRSGSAADDDADRALWLKAMTLVGGDATRAQARFRELKVARRLRPRGPAEPAGGGPSTSGSGRNRHKATAAWLTFPRLLLVASLTLPILLSLLVLPNLHLFAVPPVAAVPAGMTLVTWRSGTGRRINSPDALCASRPGAELSTCREVVLATLGDEATIVTRLPYSASLHRWSLRP